MTQRQFWSMIDATTDGVELAQAKHVNRLESRLRALDMVELASFSNRLNAALNRAYKFRLMVAAFVVHGYISDDVFLDFRGWLILLGSDRYQRIVKDADQLAQVLTRRQRRFARPCGFLELPVKVGMKDTATAATFIRHYEPREDPTIKMPWPATKEQFQARFPVLHQAFWDRKLIKSHLV